MRLPGKIPLPVMAAKVEPGGQPTTLNQPAGYLL